MMATAMAGEAALITRLAADSDVAEDIVEQAPFVLDTLPTS
jgi:hypothetical protein